MGKLAVSGESLKYSASPSFWSAKKKKNRHLLYINDIGSNINFSLHLFAHDCVIYREIIQQTGIATSQSDLVELTEWSS